MKMLTNSNSLISSNTSKIDTNVTISFYGYVFSNATEVTL